MGMADVIKKRRKKENKKKNKLYGDWDIEVGKGVDESQASGYAPLAEREKGNKLRIKTGGYDTTGYKKVRGDSPKMKDYGKPKKKKKKDPAMATPYKGRSSDLEWIKKKRKKNK